MKVKKIQLFSAPAFFSLRFKINLSYAVLILLMMIGIGLGYLFLSRIGASGLETVQYRKPMTLLTLKLESELHLSTSVLTHYLLTGEKQVRAEFKAASHHVSNVFTEMKRLAEDPRSLVDSQQLLAVEKGLATYQILAKELVELRQDRFRNYPGIRMATENLNPLSLEYLGLVNSLLAQTEDIEVPNKNKVYKLLNEIRYSWVQIVNGLRIFMSTRVASNLANITIYKDYNAELHRKLIEEGVDFGFGEVEELEQLRKDFMRNLPDILQVFSGDHWRADVGLMRTQVSPVVLELRRLLRQLADQQIAIAEQEVQALSADLRGMGVISLILLISFLGFASLVAILLSARIIPPIRNLVDAARAVSRGERDIVVPSTGRDELGLLAQAFTTMVKRVRMADKQNQRAKEQAEASRKEMEKARDSALVATKAKSTFLSNMSHEIRTPLNAILGFSQILQSSNLAPMELKAANTIERSGNHLLRLINNILDLSKIEAGQVSIQKEAFDLVGMISDVEDIFSLRCAEKGLYLEVEIPCEEYHCVLGDEPKLKQILINLVGNAVKFTEHGGIRVVVHWSDDTYSFEVSDSGNGIALPLQKVIFEPFHQEKEGLDKGGTGLGLNIAQHQVEQLGGCLEVESDAGKGARFYFSIPMELENKIYLSLANHPPKIGHLESSFTINALVVDDRKENRSLLVSILEKVGVNVWQACDGMEALTKVEEHRPDIVFLDILMPVMDGHKCIKIIREKFDFKNKIKFVAISAASFEKDVNCCATSGFDEFIRKPFLISEILACTSRLLQVEFKEDYSAVEAAVIKDKNACMPIPKDLWVKLKKEAELGGLTQFDVHINALKLWREDAYILAWKLSDRMRRMDVKGVIDLLEQCGVDLDQKTSIK